MLRIYRLLFLTAVAVGLFIPLLLQGQVMQRGPYNLLIEGGYLHGVDSTLHSSWSNTLYRTTVKDFSSNGWHAAVRMTNLGVIDTLPLLGIPSTVDIGLGFDRIQERSIWRGTIVEGETDHDRAALGMASHELARTRSSETWQVSFEVALSLIPIRELAITCISSFGYRHRVTHPTQFTYTGTDAAGQPMTHSPEPTEAGDSKSGLGMIAHIRISSRIPLASSIDLLPYLGTGLNDSANDTTLPIRALTLGLAAEIGL